MAPDSKKSGQERSEMAKQMATENKKTGLTPVYFFNWIAFFSQ